jgi:hypothetical protein
LLLGKKRNGKTNNQQLWKRSTVAAISSKHNFPLRTWILFFLIEKNLEIGHLDSSTSRTGLFNIDQQELQHTTIIRIKESLLTKHQIVKIGGKK